jgi:hypothetical protein
MLRLGVLWFQDSLGKKKKSRLNVNGENCAKWHRVSISATTGELMLEDHDPELSGMK